MKLCLYDLCHKNLAEIQIHLEILALSSCSREFADHCVLLGQQLERHLYMLAYIWLWLCHPGFPHSPMVSIYIFSPLSAGGLFSTRNPLGVVIWVREGVVKGYFHIGICFPFSRASMLHFMSSSAKQVWSSLASLHLWINHAVGPAQIPLSSSLFKTSSRPVGQMVTPRHSAHNLGLFLVGFP